MLIKKDIVSRIWNNQYNFKEDKEYNCPYLRPNWERISPSKLYLLNDKIGDRINLNESAESERENIYIYIDEQLFTPKYNCKSHSSYLRKLIINDQLRDILIKYRLNYESINLNLDLSISFGHILQGNIGIIDSITSYRISNKLLIEALINSGCSKVYIGDIVDDILLIKLIRIY